MERGFDWVALGSHSLAIAVCGLVVGGCGSEADTESTLAQSTERFSNQFLPNLDPVHESITLAALPFLKERVANYIAYQNASFDAFNIPFGDAHFDNCLFEASSIRAAQNMANAVSHSMTFPSDYNDLPDSPFSPTGLPSLPIPSSLSMASFAAALHAMQDFYSHTNWVEQGQTGLFDDALSELQPIVPFSTLGDLVVLEGPPPPGGWSVFSAARTAAYPESVLVTARFRRDVFPALISGTTEGLSHPDNCPSVHGPGITEITHELLAKDSAHTHPKEHVLAVGLATRQSTHEWCRFMNLVHGQHGPVGVEFVCDNWVEDRAAANAACPSLPDEARCVEGPLFEDTFSPQQPGWSFQSPSDGFLGELNNNINVSFVTLTVPVTQAGPGTLTFDVLAIRTLDGISCCTDTLTMTVNGAVLFTAVFHGSIPSRSQFTSNPAGATFSTPDGGFTYQVVAPVNLTEGDNTFTWSYTPLQALADEAWGLDNVVIEQP